MADDRSIMDFKLSPGLDAGRALGLRPRMIGIAQISVSDEYTYDWHRHDEYEFIVVERSPYACKLNDVSLQLKSGDVLVIKPGDRHQDMLKPPVKYFALRLSLRTQRQDELPFFAESIAADEQLCALPESIPICNQLYQEGLRSDAISGPLQNALVTELLWRLVRAFEPACMSPYLLRRTAQEELRAGLERYFLQHINDTPSLEDMATALQMGSRSLTLKCKALLQTSPAKAFKQFKMNHAMELMQHSAMPIKEISRYLGFSNPFHFSRVFKQYHGKAPSEFR